ncbi:hypothetical protein [Segetibacter koreensis]|uniref:hypothetical protein n=1 Tax=Segetibacter koreensis TaxID=398037 RepID=UPI00036306A8|nr:hypothetical protein [Segetibacter koreensis]
MYAGLETAGLVTVQRTQKLSEIGSHLIRFTNRARPYFLPMSKDAKTSDIQKVKLSDEELIEITLIKPGIDERSVTTE